MKIYEYDTSKPFNRGKLLDTIYVQGAGQQIGFLNGAMVRGYLNTLKMKRVYPSDYGVKAFMYSLHSTSSSGWETSIFVDENNAPEGFKSLAEIGERNDEKRI